MSYLTKKWYSRKYCQRKTHDNIRAETRTYNKTTEMVITMGNIAQQISASDNATELITDAPAGLELQWCGPPPDVSLQLSQGSFVPS